MRIIGGRFKGSTIEAPRGVLSRPPLAVIREAVFNIIGPEIEGRSILDLFAGSGSLGFEALSRGAARVHFVDSARRCAQMLARNSRKLGVSSLCTVARQDAVEFVRDWQGMPFDFIFVDPPFLSGKAEETLLAASGTHVLAPGALVVVRVHWREVFALPEYLVQVKKRKFGESVVMFLQIRSSVADQ